MSNVRNIIRFLTSLSGVFLVALLPLTALATGPSTKSERKPSNQERVLEPVNLAILIQDNLVSHVSNELEITRDFIESLPKGSQVMVGYITSGSLQVRQSFTNDLGKAAGSLRILISNDNASSFNPYVEVLEALRKFDPQSKNRNVLLMISDGLDDSRGFDPSVLDSIDMNRAIAEAKRRDVLIYSFYAPSVGRTSRSFLAASYGQSSLGRISRETGGQAFFQGTTDFVTFNSYFERLTQAQTQCSVRIYEARGRVIPSFRILLLRVVRFRPSRAAAPVGPAITQFDSPNTRRMCSRSTDSSVDELT